MKTGFFVIAAAAAFAGCYSSREVQVDFVNAELVRIDTIYRHPEQHQVLTWQTGDNIRYISYAPINKPFTVGARIAVMVKK